MSDEGRAVTPNPGYIAGLIARALETASSNEDAATRAAANAKIQRFTAALEGMLSGELAVGSRTPVKGAPAWATLEVVKGGFATGNLLANGPLVEHETAALSALASTPEGARFVSSFATERAALNAHALTEAGLAALIARMRDGTFRVNLPEEGALLVVAWLLDRGERAAAANVLEAIAPYFDRLRFYPIENDRPAPEASVVSLQSAHDVADKLRAKRTPRDITAMRASLAWGPLQDRVIAMLCETLSAPVTLARDEVGSLVRDAKGNHVVDGGTVGAKITPEWSARARALVSEIADQMYAASPSKRFTSNKESFATLYRALETLATGRSLGGGERHVRRMLATALHKRGAPGSPKLAKLRDEQARVRALPLDAAIAHVVAARLSKVERELGVSAIEPYMTAVEPSEASAGAPAGTHVPAGFERTLARALEATLDELVSRGVVGSGEVLAILAPKVTAQVRAAGITNPRLRRVYAATYAAFRRRRSLLLLNLAKQVQLEELPWIAAIDAHRSRSLDTVEQSRQTFAQLAELAIRSFSERILPNKLLQEFLALSKGAESKVPIVEELAADIFMGAFSEKFVSAAKVSAKMLRGTLYERYYGLPFDEVLAMQITKGRYGGVDAFAALCTRLAGENPGTWSVAYNGTIIEQQQLLTTHNLAPLFDELSLKERLGEATLFEMALRNAQWILEQHAQKLPLGRPQLVRLKNTAYAWRQMVFFLALLPEAQQKAFVRALRGDLAKAKEPFRTNFAPAVDGLALCIDDGRFDAKGAARFEGREARRFLGWTLGRHWLFGPKP
ncbi:MAG: hypothetical protein JNK05_39840 [Myxococcales bacterium]|nr:hypothetical protein [Myxococcales bacterium]